MRTGEAKVIFVYLILSDVAVPFAGVEEAG